MPLFILTETSAGYGLFKAADKKLLSSDDLINRLSTPEKIAKEIKFKEFVKFDSAATALEEISGLLEGKITPTLENLLKDFKNEKKIVLAVADKGLGNSITKLPGLKIQPASDRSTADLFRAIRQHLPDLIPGMLPENFQEMSLGLSHSLSRHKLKFSADKVDIMIVHAVSLLDELDKELNTYAMRVKEWYGWHFPELAKILNDNIAYARVVMTLGLRQSALDADLSEVLPEEIETAVKAAADISMGQEITAEDLDNIQQLADQVVRYSEYRAQLSQYLENRMKAIAPNMTELVGYLVGARLIAHAGSLMGLAKSPGSTLQILGAEKALFRALKTKHSTPKYGLIYHASLVGQASGKNKGKIARQLASKLALGVRNDALGEVATDDGQMNDDERSAMGARDRAKLENNLRRLEGRPLNKSYGSGTNGAVDACAPTKWNVKEARKYNVDADGLDGNEPAPHDQETAAEDAMDVDAQDNASDDENETVEKASGKRERKKEKKEKSEKKEKKDKKSKKSEGPEEVTEAIMLDDDDEEEGKEENDTGEADEADALGPGQLSATDLKRLAKLAGMRTSKFTRRYERGDIKINADGTIQMTDKGESKKSKSSKRKHIATKEDGEAETPKKERPAKKKKHSKSDE